MRWKSILLIFLGACSYGVLSTIVKFAYGAGYSLGEVVGSQMLTGTVIMWLIVLFRQGVNGKAARAAGNGRAASESSKITLTKAMALMAAGAPTGATGLLYYGALQHIPASLAIVLLFQFTWMSVLIEAAGKRRMPGPVVLASLAVLLTGTLLAAGVLERGLQFTLWGIVLGLLSAVSYTLFIQFAGKAVPEVDPARRSAWMLTGAVILVFILFPPAFLFHGVLWSGLLIYGVPLALFGAVIPSLFFSIGVPNIGEGLTGILGAAELPVAVILSSFVLHEHVSVLQWAGVIVVLIGVALPESVKRGKRWRVTA